MHHAARYVAVRAKNRGLTQKAGVWYALGVDMEDDMDDKLNALDKLIEAVELPCVSLKASYMLDALPVSARTHCWRAHAGSLDAALALHEALLPGWGWKTQKLLCNDYYTAEVWGEYAYSEESGTSTTPARAWLQAILRAYRRMQQ